LLNCLKFIKKRECQHQWRVYHVYLPAMRVKCLRCGQKKTVTFDAFAFLRWWIVPYLENPQTFKNHRKTIEFFEINKATIIRNTLEEIRQKISRLEKEKQELRELERFCRAIALL